LLLDVKVQKDVHGWSEELGSEEVHHHVVDLHDNSHECVLSGLGNSGNIGKSWDEKDEE
jgi:hypothetical protein